MPIGENLEFREVQKSRKEKPLMIPSASTTVVNFLSTRFLSQTELKGNRLYFLLSPLSRRNVQIAYVQPR